jgi:hypothetical protein
MAGTDTGRTVAPPNLLVFQAFPAGALFKLPRAAVSRHVPSAASSVRTAM